MKHAEMVEIVDRYINAYNARDVETILSLYAPDATMEDPVGSPPARTAEERRGLYQMGFDMGINMEPDGRPRTAADRVAFPLRAVSPTGTLYVIDIFEFDEKGRIARMNAIWSAENLEGEMDVHDRLES